MAEEGWIFGSTEGGTADDVNEKQLLHQIYTLADPDFTGRVTVPVLWDRQTRSIVNNESSEILRMFNSEFDALVDSSLDLYPEALRGQIDELNSYIYPRINNGVYRCGFATTQEAYEEAYHDLFEGLDEIDARLASSRYLLGSQFTEADWRLFTTLIRFDAVYVGLFKCNVRRIDQYPNLFALRRRLLDVDGVTGTVKLDQIKTHYYASLRGVNPSGVVPAGPELVQ